MIDIVVEALLDRDLTAMIAVADLRDNATRSRLHDLGQHAILDADRALVLEKDDLFAGGKVAIAIGRHEGRTVPNDPMLDELGACELVQRPDITAQMRE